MTMILDAFLRNFSTLLTKMAEDEVGMLLGVPGEIEKLGRTVHDIQCVISDAEGKQTKSSAIKQWLLELTDVMYDADDLMDLCQIKAEDRRTRYSYLSSSKFSCGINLLSCFRNPIFAHEMGKKIKDLNSRLDEIAKRKSGLGLRLQDVVGQSSNFHRERSNINRKTDPSIVQDDIVGEKIEEDAQMLVKWLTTEEMSIKENVSVVAIVGMGGIGKTTLAKKVFNDPRIKEEFRLQLWVCVSKDLKEIELLKCVIREAGGNYGAAEERAELVPILQELVRGKKFFLVLDDVWPHSKNVWVGLLRDPMIGGAHGSKLLVTTRDDGVARFLNATSTHRVDKLSDEEAWSLLIKQVALDENESKNLKDMGLELVTKCAGLPLAVKTIGGVLRMRGKNRVEWQTILRSNLWSLIDLPTEFPHAFYLSYEDLPPNLKQCFIFCSLYPEDYEFKTELIYSWLAEGFLCDKGDSSFFEFGRENCKELISRNLLEVIEEYYDQERCKMHDLLRSFAQYMGNDDSFIMREGELSCRSESKSLLKLRRLSIERTVVDSDLEFFNKEKSLRTLLLNNNFIGDVMSNVLSSFSRLRIVDLTSSKISSLPDSFCDLVHLRYLDATGSMLETLPNSIGNLRKLELLGLGYCKRLSHVPFGIFNLLHLRFLSFYGTNIEVFPAGLKKLKKLVELHGFVPDKNNSNGHGSLEDLGTLSQLSKLSLCNLDKVSDVTVAKKANLEEKIHLKYLKFFYNSNQGRQDSHPTEERKAIEEVLNALSPPPSIEILKIHGYFGRQLPKWLYVGLDPSKLKFLRFLWLRQCECFSQLPPLGLLPNLDFLRVEGAISVVKIGREFLLDDRTEVNHSSILLFPQLNSLEMKGMLCWVEWLWEEGQPAMPKLKKILIDTCPKLISLPKGLSRHATSLEYLDITAAEQLTFVEDLQSVKDLRVFENPNLKGISNLPNLSYILIENCPNLETLENLKSLHRMELNDSEIETLPDYLKTIMPEKLTVCCREELIMKIISLGVGSSEWQKFEHIPVVKINAIDESISAVYSKTPFSFTTKPQMPTEISKQGDIPVVKISSIDEVGSVYEKTPFSFTAIPQVPTEISKQGSDQQINIQ